MNDIKVSVIIPYYNNENEIKRAIESVINQTYKKFEIIAIDDCSSDNSYEIVNSLINKYREYKIINIRNEKNSGPAETRNYGVKFAKGEYIAFLDADDEWAFNKLEIQIDLFEKYKDEIVIVGSLYKIKESNEKILFENNSKIYFKKINFNNGLFKNYFYTSSIILHKSLFNKIGGFPINQKYSEDYNFVLKVLCEGKGLIIKNPLIFIFKFPYGEKGLSSKLFLMEKGELNNYIELFKEKKINAIALFLTILFSILKFVKRIIYSNFWIKWRNKWKN